MSTLMDPEELAKILVGIIGNRVKLEIIRFIVREIGYSRLARLAGTKPGSIATSLGRGSIGDDLCFRIFKGLIIYKPYMLRCALEHVVGRYEKLLRNVIEKIRERER